MAALYASFVARRLEKQEALPVFAHQGIQGELGAKAEHEDLDRKVPHCVGLVDSIGVDGNLFNENAEAEKENGDSKNGLDKP